MTVAVARGEEGMDVNRIFAASLASSSKLIAIGSSFHNPRRRSHAPVTFTNLAHKDVPLINWVVVTVVVTVNVRVPNNCLSPLSPLPLLDDILI